MVIYGFKIVKPGMEANTEVMWLQSPVAEVTLRPAQVTEPPLAEVMPRPQEVMELPAEVTGLRVIVTVNRV